MEETLISGSYDTIATIFALILFYLVKYTIEWWNKKKAQPLALQEMDHDRRMHQDIADNLIRIESFLSIASNEYSRTPPLDTIKAISERMFRLARYAIYMGVTDLLTEELNWGNQHVRERFFQQVDDMVENIYNNDCNFMKQFEYESLPLSDLMNESWKGTVITTCRTFVANHYDHGNNYIVFARNLKNDFERISYEFKSKL